MSDEAKKELREYAKRKREETSEKPDDDLVHVETQDNYDYTPTAVATVSRNKLLKNIDSELSDSDSDNSTSEDGIHNDCNSEWDSEYDSDCASVCHTECDSDCEDNAANDDRIDSSDGIRVWDWLQLQTLLDATSVCKSCKIGQLSMTETDSRRQGWYSYIGLQCTNQECDRHKEYDVVPTSPFIDMKYIVIGTVVLVVLFVASYLFNSPVVPITIPNLFLSSFSHIEIPLIL